MPANKKYLTRSPWHRTAKFIAAILGGYAITTFLHMLLALWFDKATVINTGSYSIYLLWITLMILAFLAKNGYKILALYFFISALLYGVFYLAS